MANQLAQAASPYLLQHRDNPVDWREWTEATLAEAKRERKPILLSVGYAACHWCHVMAHESFEDPAVAGLMRREFVSIKVDREERPDIDAVYQQALQLMGEHGGWPLTMFLTPEGEPFWGGTYFPPEPRYGRPSFTQVLEQVAQLWATKNPRLESNRVALAGALRQLASPEGGEGVPPALVTLTAERLAEQFDAVHGGLGGAPKFPQAPMLRFLWQTALSTGEEALRERVLHTLTRMSQGGIYDHLGGGYARYSVDAYWLVPHFEKMLYDNAQLLDLLGRVFALANEPLFAQRAAETVAWLEREMLVDGAFAASLDADSEGEEGRYYVWQAEEVDTLLGEDAPAFKLAYGVTAAGNWEGKTILHRLHAAGLPPAEQAERLARSRERLLAVREGRVHPGRDDKVLADWNGLMIAGLAEAAGFLDQAAWLALAQRAFDAVLARMSEGDRLFHSWRDGRRLPMAFLDDYAAMAAAGVTLHEHTGETMFLDRALAWIAVLDADYRATGGAYHTTAATAGDLMVRPLTGRDGPLPSGNGTLAQVSARLWHLTGDDRHRLRAQAILAALSGEVRRDPAGHASLLEAVSLLERPVQLVVAGNEATPGFAGLWQAALASPVPHRVLLRLAPGQELPVGHPASGKALRDGRAAAYLCLGQTCEAPFTEAEGFSRRLAELVAPGQGTS